MARNGRRYRDREKYGDRSRERKLEHRMSGDGRLLVAKKENMAERGERVILETEWVQTWLYQVLQVGHCCTASFLALSVASKGRNGTSGR
jgi:hypothetical protein